MKECNPRKAHELHDFMLQLTNDIAAEYTRIQKRVKEDPGTAGDEGEENWAELLRNWLPPNYQVVTKGRILGERGTASPQVDVIVLSPAYPKQLVDKKLYLAGGVAAAFECKLTLRPEHLQKAFQTASKIQQLVEDRHGSPFDELHSPVIYGLLAHSHSWKDSTPDSLIAADLIEENNKAARVIKHPKEALDIICIADLCTLSVNKFICPSFIVPTKIYAIHVGYNQWIPKNKWPAFPARGDSPDHNPIGIMLCFLLSRLAWEDQSIRRLASYYIGVLRTGVGFTVARIWPLDILSDEVRKRVLAEQEPELRHELWDKWSKFYLF